MAKWSGSKDAGTREYTAQQYARTVQCLQAYFAGRDNKRPMEEIATICHMSNRTLRAIISDADGVEFILGDDGDGNYFLADLADDTEHQTAKLFAQANSLKARAVRRSAYAQSMKREQGILL